MGKNSDDTNQFTVSVTLSSFEVDFLIENLTSSRDTRKLNQIANKLRTSNQQDPYDQHDNRNGDGYFKGKRQQTLDDDGETILLLQGNNNNNNYNRGASKYQLKRSSYQGQHDDRESAAQPPETESKQAFQTNNGTDGRRKKLLSSSSSTSSVSSLGKGGIHATGIKRKSLMGHHGGGGDYIDSDTHRHRPEWYLIYQAEQIRNKFSFTMKMYADEVGGWLAEAEQADQDEMSLMINRNQIRAEHIAMARLARRNLAEMQQQTGAFDDGHLLDWTRPRSWSTSDGGSNIRGSRAMAAEQHRDQSDVSPTKGGRKASK